MLKEAPSVISGFEINKKPMVFSPHTSLAAIDDGATLYIIYKSDDGAIKIIHASNRPLIVPDRLDDSIINPTPNSAISACLSPDKTKIILFYQSLNQISMKIDLYGVTLYKASTASNAEWTHGNNSPEILGD
ncbi:hypothetical protein Trco_001662 [Trichoderma cornu-damae]|uniref:Fucose-specific lectin n=1 Tax=Trichoderma cornu-damae TaxID=654480 RepID=A0A9P8QZA2_9HYPO|nr:hypothetical protein Trco_001662 [Trichoderma cornu-damae]